MRFKPIFFCVLALCLTCLSCATTQIQDIKPGEKPALESDEAGLWMAMDNIEANLKTSGRPFFQWHRRRPKPVSLLREGNAQSKTAQVQ